MEQSTFHIPGQIRRIRGARGRQTPSRQAWNFHSGGFWAAQETSGTAKPPRCFTAPPSHNKFPSPIKNQERLPLSAAEREKSAPFQAAVPAAPKPCLQPARRCLLAGMGIRATSFVDSAVLADYARTGVVRHRPLRWLLRLPLAVETCCDGLALVSLPLPLWARSAGWWWCGSFSCPR